MVGRGPFGQPGSLLGFFMPISVSVVAVRASPVGKANVQRQWIVRVLWPKPTLKPASKAGCRHRRIDDVSESLPCSCRFAAVFGAAETQPLTAIGDDGELPVGVFVQGIGGRHGIHVNMAKGLGGLFLDHDAADASVDRVCRHLLRSFSGSAGSSGPIQATATWWKSSGLPFIRKSQST